MISPQTADQKENIG